MCIAIWTLNHPDYSLILCTNRDEYLARPTANACFHGPDNSILSGTDLQAGGSWFGINRTGRVALLTNISETSGPYPTSRGELVSHFLLPDAPDHSRYTQILSSDDSSAVYAGFNLLLLSPRVQSDIGAVNVEYEATLVTNSGGGGRVRSRKASPGEYSIGAISNGVDGVDGEQWPKVIEGKRKLNDLVTRDETMTEEELVNNLFGILLSQAERRPSNRFELRNSIHIEPVRMSGSLEPNAKGEDWHEKYGTRLSSVLLVRRDGRVLFVERDIWKFEEADGEHRVSRGDPRRDRVFTFKIE